MKLLCIDVAVVLFALVSVSAGQEHEHPASPGEKLGTVHFATSCAAGAQPTFDRAVALLHSFEFGPAIDAFQSALAADPSCAMAQWGIALARWSNPFAVGARSAAALQQGRDAIDRARALGPKSDRERAYVNAAALLYTDVETRPQATRAAAYRDAMAKVAADYRDDTEASIFYALSLTASEDPTDKSYASRLKAVAILEPLFAKQPQHPGLAHYIIHSYDVPPLAAKGLDAARRYATIAPSAPHALHMPSHIFTRVGYWQESIGTNIASAAAARRERQAAEELHATDYLTYAYLQSAQDAAARQLVDALPEIMSRFTGGSVASAAPPAAAAFAYAAIPARWTLERGAWAAAARLEIHPSAVPYADALTFFARAVGAARSGNPDGGGAAIRDLERLQDEERRRNEPYWADQIEIQRRAAAAWVRFAEGRRTDAIAEMRTAVDAEQRTEKAAVTPGPLAPAREMLGEMLLAMDDPAAALTAFDATLQSEPNRFRGLYGAMTAAARSGRQAEAKRYAGTLIKMCERADGPGRPELNEARAIARARLPLPH